MTNKLQLFDLLDACRARLKALEYFANLTVITENDGDLLTTINTAIAKAGLCIVIGGVEARNTRLNASSPVWFPITFSVVVEETVVINRSASGTGKPAQVVADQAAEQLHHFVTDWGTVVVVAMRPLSDKTRNIYELECQIGQ